MSIWHVTIEVAADQTDSKAPDPAALDEFLELLGPEAAVSGTPEEPADGKVRYGADITIDDNDIHDMPRVVSVALDLFRGFATKAGLPDWPLARLEVLSDTEVDAQLAQPNFPELVGVSEVAGLLDVTKQRVSALAKSESFPEPVVRLESGPIWTLPSVRRFVENWARRPGRPARVG
ncbi:MAG: hypothetical protein AB1679_14960 [Actinomycetota bacterium]